MNVFADLSLERRALLELLLIEEALGSRAGEKAPASEAAPLSFGQERLWLLDRLDPGSPAYNTATALRLLGPLDPEILARSFAEIARRHAVLRTVFREEMGKPVQVVLEPRPVELPVVDLADTEALMAAVDEEVRQPFDLAHGPLFRVRLFRLGAEEHVLVITLHHIVSDAWSMGVLAGELTALYAAFAAGQPSHLPELPIQYADHARRQRERLDGPALEEQLAWWRRRLAGAPEVLEVPTDRPRPPVRRFHGGMRTRKLPRELSAAVARLSEERAATPFMVLFTAFEVLLHVRAGATDLVVGVDVANRDEPETEALIGFFLNQLVLRVDASGDPSFLDLLERAREASLGAFAHRDLPFGRLVEELSPQRSLARNPLFQVMFGFYNVPAPQVEEPGGLRVEPLDLDGGTAVFDLSLYLAESPEGLLATMRYDADLYDAATAERLLEDFEIVAARALDFPGGRISDLSRHLMEERRRRLDAGREALQKARLRTMKTARRRTLGADGDQE